MFLSRPDGVDTELDRWRHCMSTPVKWKLKIFSRLAALKQSFSFIHDFKVARHYKGERICSFRSTLLPTSPTSFVSYDGFGTDFV